MKIENSVFTKTKLMLRQKNKNKKQTLTISILNHLWSCSFKRKCFCDDRNTLNTDHQDCWHSQYWSCLAAPLPLTLLGLPPVHCQGHCSPSYQKKKKKTTKNRIAKVNKMGTAITRKKGQAEKLSTSSSHLADASVKSNLHQVHLSQQVLLKPTFFFLIQMRTSRPYRSSDY